MTKGGDLEVKWGCVVGLGMVEYGGDEIRARYPQIKEVLRCRTEEEKTHQEVVG